VAQHTDRSWLLAPAMDSLFDELETRLAAESGMDNLPGEERARRSAVCSTVRHFANGALLDCLFASRSYVSGSVIYSITVMLIQKWSREQPRALETQRWLAHIISPQAAVYGSPLGGGPFASCQECSSSKFE
jgi:hypothetical protein